jgi:hypothetical protein
MCPQRACNGSTERHSNRANTRTHHSTLERPVQKRPSYSPLPGQPSERPSLHAVADVLHISIPCTAGHAGVDVSGITISWYACARQINSTARSPLPRLPRLTYAHSIATRLHTETQRGHLARDCNRSRSRASVRVDEEHYEHRARKRDTLSTAVSACSPPPPVSALSSKKLVERDTDVFTTITYCPVVGIATVYLKRGVLEKKSLFVRHLPINVANGTN